MPAKTRNPEFTIHEQELPHDKTSILDNKRAKAHQLRGTRSPRPRAKPIPFAAEAFFVATRTLEPRGLKSVAEIRGEMIATEFVLVATVGVDASGTSRKSAVHAELGELGGRTSQPPEFVPPVTRMLLPFAPSFACMCGPTLFASGQDGHGKLGCW